MMNLRANGWTLPVTTLAILCGAVEAQAQTQLRWKYTPGQVFQHNMSQEATTSINLAGRAIESTSTLSVDNVWTVNKVDSQGTADISQNTSRVKLKITSAMGSIDVDTASETPPADAIGKQLATSLGTLTKAKITFKLNAVGEVSDVQVAASAGAAGAAGDPLTEMLGKEGITSMVKQSIQSVPKEAVKKDSMWANKIEVTLPLLGKVVTDSQLTYNGPVKVDGKTLEQIKIETRTIMIDSPAENRPLQFTIKDQSEKGTVYFDNSSGRFSHSDVTQVMTIEFARDGQKIEQTVKTIRKSVLRPAEK